MIVENVTTDPWRKLLSDVYNAPETSPRGMRTKELCPYTMVLENPLASMWCRFPSRKLNINYAAFEFLWYLRGNPLDLSITERAGIWKDIAKKGPIQSNYGVYLFGQGQVHRVVTELTRDKDSRRAVICILQPEHFANNAADIPCTLNMTFQIRENELNCYVTMRSSDIIFGMGNDVPCFVWTMHLVYWCLKEFYPDLKMGSYYHTSYSMHLYERHFEMVSTILDDHEVVSSPVNPQIASPQEAYYAIDRATVITQNYDKIPDEYKWCKWMHCAAKEK